MKRLSQGPITLIGVEDAVRMVLPYGKGASNRSSSPDWASDPTSRLYGELLTAWAHFNKHLFGGRLRPCIITLSGSGRAAGYFAKQRFQTRDGTILVDEIAINPVIFHTYSLTDIFSTLAHEMVHARQAQFGHPSDGGYHNKEWADWMERIGLIPSDTGMKEGQKTGVHMSHYIQPGGLFEGACADLIAQGLRISFVDRRAVLAQATPGVDLAHDKKQARRKLKAASKTRFGCPTCPAVAWGKDKLKIDCRRCRQPMSASGSDEEKS